MSRTRSFLIGLLLPPVALATAVLSLCACRAMAGQPAAAVAPALHPSAAAALALVFAPVKPPAAPAEKPADPFAAGNAAAPKADPAYTHHYETGCGGRYVCDCGCIETGKCNCKNCCSPTKTRPADAKATSACVCKDASTCTCPPGDCTCPACLAKMVWERHDEDQLDLLDADGKQVGGYRISTGKYLPRVGDGWGDPCKAPVRVPTDPTAYPLPAAPAPRPTFTPPVLSGFGACRGGG